MENPKDRRITTENFTDEVKKTRSSQEPRAFLNMKGAPFADGGYVNWEFNLLLQFKNRSVARLSDVKERTVPPVSQASIKAELKKVDSISEPFLLLYITHERKKAGARIPSKVILVHAENAELFFGRVFTEIVSLWTRES